MIFVPAPSAFSTLFHRSVASSLDAVMIGFLLSTFSVRVAYMAFRSPFVTTHSLATHNKTPLANRVESYLHTNYFWSLGVQV
jgi:hypothetical protein